MASSPKEPSSVDPSRPDELQPDADAARPSAKRPRTSSRRQDYGVPSQGRYSPVALAVDVVQHLRDQGVAVSEAVENLHEAIEASAELLRWIGVVPDRRVLTRPPEHTAELVAAAVLMRAAGIEPSAIKTWPRLSA